MRYRLLPVLMLLLLAAVLGGCAAAVADAPAAEEVSDYTNPAVLVDSDWVAEHLDDPQVHLLDVSDKAFVWLHLPRLAAQLLEDEA